MMKEKEKSKEKKRGENPNNQTPITK